MKYNVYPENNIIVFCAYNNTGKKWQVKYLESKNGHTFARLSTIMYICNEFKFTKPQALRAIKCAVYEGYKVKENKK